MGGAHSAGATMLNTPHQEQGRIVGGRDSVAGDHGLVGHPERPYLLAAGIHLFLHEVPGHRLYGARHVARETERDPEVRIRVRVDGEHPVPTAPHEARERPRHRRLSGAPFPRHRHLHRPPSLSIRTLSPRRAHASPEVRHSQSGSPHWLWLSRPSRGANSSRKRRPPSVTPRPLSRKRPGPSVTGSTYPSASSRASSAASLAGGATRNRRRSFSVTVSPRPSPRNQYIT